jgi:hypothetical protein
VPKRGGNEPSLSSVRGLPTLFLITENIEAYRRHDKKLLTTSYLFRSVLCVCKWVWKFYSTVSLQANRDETQTADPSAARADAQALIAAGKSTLLYLGIEC